MTLEKLESEKDKLHIELRDLLAKRTEIDLMWKRDGIPTDVVERAELNMQIDDMKRQLTRAEGDLRQAKRQGRMDKYDALCFVCKENGHDSYIAEAEALANGDG
jgi:uncharacterized protein involved in exopolysaccharide biosynthesis